MAALILIRSELFVTRLRASDYQIIRDGFCLWVKNDKTRQGYLMLREDLIKMITVLQNSPIVKEEFMEAVLVGDATVWRIPSDEQIIQYCIDKAFIPHPFEEYVSAP